MRYRYLDDFGRGISVFAIFSYGTVVVGTPNVPLLTKRAQDFSCCSPRKCCLFGHIIYKSFIYQAYSIKMAVYWPRLGLYKRTEELGQYPAILTFCLVNNDSGNSNLPNPPSPRHLSFFIFLEKLKMPNGGAGRFIQKPQSGA